MKLEKETMTAKILSVKEEQKIKNKNHQLKQKIKDEKMNKNNK